jgi:hypothetical protein
MPIGALPTIPLYRVQPNPDARFQRFGLNDSQLYGKPMAEFSAPALRPAQVERTPARPEEPSVRTQSAATSNPGVEPASSQSLLNPSKGQTGPGALVDTKA